MSNPEYDKFGYCAFCHKSIGSFPFENEPWKIKWSPEKITTKFKLSSGSTLHVNLCKGCEKEIEVDDFNKLFTSVVDGWKEELTHCDEMSEQEKIDYINNYQELRIMEKV